MKRYSLLFMSILICNSAMALDFSGNYKCKLIDNADGAFTAALTLKKDANASLDKEGYGSYLVNFTVKGIPYNYTGIAASRGNEIAIYFESIGSNRNPNDKGVGIASVLTSFEKDGKKSISFNKFYYEKSYKGKSNYGFEKCIKVE